VTTRSTGVVYTRTSTFKGERGGKYCWEVTNPKSGDAVLCANGEGNVVEAQNTIRTPHSGLFAWPMTVGKEWEYAFSGATKSGQPTGNFTKHVKVVSYEKVVAGGQTYDAFKIEAAGRNMSGGYPWSETAWYAPSIGKTVKYESTDFDGYELIGCSGARGDQPRPGPSFRRSNAHF
jgi:hypothetical protein